MPNILYDLAVRLSFSAPAFAMAIGSAMGSLNGLRNAATDAQKALDAFGVQNDRMSQVTYKHQAAVDALTNSQIQLRRATEDYNRLTGPNSTAQPATIVRAQERVDMAQRRTSLAAQRLGNTVNPVAAQAAIDAGTVTATTAVNDANAALGRGVDAQNQIMGGAVLAAGGYIGLRIAGAWVKAGMEMEGAMEKVRLATGASNDEMAKLEQQSMTTASRVQMSSTQVMNVALLAATSGFNNPAMLRQSLPTLANAAEIAQRMRGVDPTASVPEFVRMAHLFQQYGAQAGDSPAAAAFKNNSFNQMLNLAARSLLVSGSTPAELSRVMQYMAAARSEFSLKPGDIIDFASLAMNVGLTGGRGGGSRIARVVQQVIPNRSRAHNEALKFLQEKAGANFLDASGGLSTQFYTNPLLNIMKVVEMADQHISNPALRARMIGDIFGSAGQAAVGALSNPSAIARGLTIQTQLGTGTGSLPTTAQMQSGLAGITQGNINVLQTNLHSISQILGQQLLPAVNAVAAALAHLTGGLMEFLSHHQALAQFVAVFTVLASVGALAAGGVLMVAGAVALLTPAMATLGITTAIAFLPLTLIILGVGAAIAGIIVVASNWGNIMKSIGGILKDMGITELASEIGTIVKGFAQWADLSHILEHTFGGMVDLFHQFLVWAGMISDHPAARTNTQLSRAQAQRVLHDSRQPTTTDQSTNTLRVDPNSIKLRHPHPTPHALVRGRNDGGAHGRGGGSGHAGTNLTVINNVSGADHATTRSLTEKIGDHTIKRIEEHFAGAIRYDSSSDHPLEVAYR